MPDYFLSRSFSEIQANLILDKNWAEGQAKDSLSTESVERKFGLRVDIQIFYARLV
jgi:hypothetical protein